jgi:hypothetical protein
VALSNGNLSMLTDLFAAAGLTWHCVLSGEMAHACKPDPAVYQLAIDRLALDPNRTLMVAAHPWDLRAATAHGLRTAYIQRAGEGAPEPSDTFDLTSPDLAALAHACLPRREHPGLPPDPTPPADAAMPTRHRNPIRSPASHDFADPLNLRSGLFCPVPVSPKRVKGTDSSRHARGGPRRGSSRASATAQVGKPLRSRMGG